MKSDDKKPDSSSLRRKAEDLLSTSASPTDLVLVPFSEFEARRMILELEVHKIELELQNEELLLAKKRFDASTAKFIELYDLAPSGYFTFSREGAIIDLNRFGSQILGKTRQDLINSRFGFFVSEDSRLVFSQFLEDVFLSTTHVSCEVAMATEGTGPLYVHLSGIARENREQCLVSMVDISDRKQLENTYLVRLSLLHFAESHTLDELLEETLNQAEILTGSLIGFYHFVETDQKTLRLQNWSTRTKRDFCRAEGKGMHYDLDLAGVWVDCVREGRPVIHNDYSSVPNKKGLPPGHAWISREMVVPIFRNGKIKAILGVGNKPSDYGDKDLELVTLIADLAWDIAERKLQESALRRSEEKWRQLVTTIPDYIALFDLEGRYQFLNRYAEGFSEKDVIGKSGLDFLSEESRELFRRHFELSIQSKKSETFELLAFGGKGEMRRYEHFIVPVQEEGEVVNIMTVARDITEKRKAEEELKLKNEELLRINAEKDKFFSVIAHDLRSPFNTLLGFTRMMVEELPTLTLDEIQMIAGSMRTSATNLYRLLDNLLEWSRMQRNVTAFEPETILLMPKIAESLQLVLESANKKGIGISYDVPEDIVVFVDENMFGSVIRNVFSNAVKFTHKGGKITIKAKAAAASFVEISIRDTGVGMGKDILDQLFLLDERKSRKGTDGEAGTGLGLLICKDFVEKQGGKLWVESKEGKGSTFHFTVPAGKS